MAETIGYNRNRKIGKRMSKETAERLTFAQRALELGQSFRQKKREGEWDNSFSTYSGEEWTTNPDDPTADIVNVNVSFSTINTLVPFVSDEDPEFLITPYSGDATAENAELLQSFMNRMWKSSDMRGQLHLSDATFDYLLYGDGYLKVGYEIKMKEIFDDLGDVVTNRVDVARFFVQRINPWDVWIDPFSDGIHNARWVCQRIVLPISELIADDRYKVGKREDVGGGPPDSRNMAPEDRLRLDDVVTEDWATIFEFYNIEEGWMMAFTRGGTNAIRYIEHVKNPIVQMGNYRVPNQPYHIGELEQIASLQHELNKTRSQMITHRRRNVAKWAIRTHLLNDEAQEAMKSSRVNDIIPIEANEPIENLITQIAPVPLSADSYQIDAQIRSDINEITGVNEYLRGVPQNISRTATEATIIEGATNIRTRHKLLQVERAARELGQLLLDTVRDVLPLTDFEEMRQFVTGREAERLNRATGAEELNTDLIFTPTPELFVGKYEVEVTRGSTELRNPQVQAQNLRTITQLMISATPTLLQLGVTFDIQNLLIQWLEAEGLDDVESMFEPDEQQDLLSQIALAGQANAAAGGGPAGAPGGGGPVRGAPTQPGEPRQETSQPPSALPDEENSGILGSR